MMEKGKSGLALSATAAIAFVLSFFGYVQILVLVVGFAILVEKSNWLTKQTLQALFAGIALTIASSVISAVFNGINTFWGWVNLYGAASVFSTILSVILAILNVAFFVLCAIGFLRVVKEKDANLPVIGNLADKCLGILTPKPAPASPQPTPYASTAPVAPAAPTAWVCACGKVNDGNFCMGCGAKRT